MKKSEKFLLGMFSSLLAAVIFTAAVWVYNSKLLDHYISVPAWLLLLAITAILSLFWFVSRTNNVKRAGIEMICPFMTEKLVEEMFKEGSTIQLVNIFLHNYSMLEDKIIEAIKIRKCLVEVNLISSDSIYAKKRGEELKGHSVVELVKTDHTNLMRVYGTLDDHEKALLKIYEYSISPKFLLYGSRKCALVGFFWHGKHAVNGPIVKLSGDSGFFANSIWNYFQEISNERKDITQELWNKYKPN